MPEKDIGYIDEEKKRKSKRKYLSFPKKIEDKKRKKYRKQNQFFSSLFSIIK